MIEVSGVPVDSATIRWPATLITCARSAVPSPAMVVSLTVQRDETDDTRAARKTGPMPTESTIVDAFAASQRCDARSDDRADPCALFDVVLASPALSVRHAKATDAATASAADRLVTRR
jgi:hypothetical protein